ncbi:MAG: hypothetical protein AAF658_14170, partial [Myxococcota bacterium]
LQFSYFTELHRGWYAPPSDGSPDGRYIIEERSRCDSEFPLAYPEPTDSWRGCVRNRHAEFNANRGRPGFDFARWNCDAESGTCPELPLPFNTPVHDETGWCAAGLTLPPSDGEWRGMLHHSQFRCTQVVPPNRLPLDRASAPNLTREEDYWDSVSFDDGSTYQMVVCGATENTSPLPGADSASEPEITCTPRFRDAFPDRVASGDVGWGLVRFVNRNAGEDYVAGCVDECRHPVRSGEPACSGGECELQTLCPGFDVDPNVNLSSCSPDPELYGLSICGQCAQAGRACQVLDMGGQPKLGVCLAGELTCNQVTQIAECRQLVQPSATDFIGDQIDSNCDGFDGDASSGVFVSRSGTNGAAGTPTAPLASVQEAITVAATTLLDNAIDDRPFIYVEENPGDPYVESNLVLLDGVAILGGFSIDSTGQWSRVLSSEDPGDAPVSEISVTAASAVVANGLTVGATLQDLRITGGDATVVGQSAYGLYAVDSTGLAFTNVEIVAGNARAGANGSSGGNVATGGSTGSRGGEGCEDSGVFCANCGRPGGGGGAGPRCGSFHGRGGNGGRPGKGTSDGDNGSGGTSGCSCDTNSTCTT